MGTLGDTTAFYLSHSIFLQRSISQGDFPWWNPYVQSGSPELWDLHPIMLAIHTLIPDGVIAYKLYSFLPGLLIGLGAYLFIGLFVRPFSLRLLGALLVQYSPLSSSHTMAPLLQLGLAHIPFLLYFAESIFRKPNSRWNYLGLAVVTGLLVLNMYPHLIAFGLIAAAGFFTGRVLLNKKKEGFLRRRWLFFIFVILGVGIGSVSLLLEQTLASQWSASRASKVRSLEWQLRGSLKARDLLSFFAFNLPDPDLQKEGFTFSPHQVNMPWLTLGILLFFRRPFRKRVGAIIIGLTVLSYFVALGANNPAFVWLFTRLPWWLRIDVPTRALFVSSTLLPLLAVLGYSALWSRVAKGNRDLFGFAIILATVIFTIILTEQFGFPEEKGRIGFYIAFGMAGALLALASLGVSSTLNRGLFTAGIIALILMTPMTMRAAFFFNVTGRHAIPVSWIRQNPTVSKLRDSDKYARFTSISSERQVWHDQGTLALMLPDMGAIYGMFSTGSYMLVMQHSGEELEKVAISTELLQPESTLSLTRMAGVRWVISDRPLTNKLLSPIGTLRDGRAVNYYEVVGTLPRTFVPSEVQFFGTKSLIPKEGASYDPLQLAQIEVSDTRLESRANLKEGSGPGQVQILDYRNTYVKLGVQMAKSGWVVLSDSFYPGWKASLDGSPVSIYRANYVYRAVFVPAGQHTVTFNYLPPLLGLGLVVGLLSMAAALVIALFVGRSNTRLLR
ncbi:MAG: YfhO family protein [Candidatus Aminicenantales bacterium]